MFAEMFVISPALNRQRCVAISYSMSVQPTLAFVGGCLANAGQASCCRVTKQSLIIITSIDIIIASFIIVFRCWTHLITAALPHALSYGYNIMGDMQRLDIGFVPEGDDSTFTKDKTSTLTPESKHSRQLPTTISPDNK